MERARPPINISGLPDKNCAPRRVVRNFYGTKLRRLAFAGGAFGNFQRRYIPTSRGNNMEIYRYYYGRYASEAATEEHIAMRLAIGLWFWRPGDFTRNW